NGLVLISVKVRLHTRSYSDYFIVSLCLADFFVGIMVMPLMTVYSLHIDWPFDYRICHIWMSADFTCSTASFLTLASMALDRYWALGRPYNHLRNRSRSTVLIFIFLSWLVPLSVWPLSIFLSQRITHKKECDHPAHPGFIVILSTFFYYIPLAFMLICYSRIIVNIKCIEILIKGEWGTVKFNPDGSTSTGTTTSNEAKQQHGRSIMETWNISTMGKNTNDNSVSPPDSSIRTLLAYFTRPRCRQQQVSNTQHHPHINNKNNNGNNSEQTPCIIHGFTSYRYHIPVSNGHKLTDDDKTRMLNARHTTTPGQIPLSPNHTNVQITPTTSLTLIKAIHNETNTLRQSSNLIVSTSAMVVKQRRRGRSSSSHGASTQAKFTGNKRSPCQSIISESKEDDDRDNDILSINGSSHSNLHRSRLSSRTASLPLADCLCYFQQQLPPPPPRSYRHMTVTAVSDHEYAGSTPSRSERSHSHSHSSEYSEHSSSFDDEEHRRLRRNCVVQNTSSRPSTSFNSSRYSSRAIANFMRERQKARLRRNQKASRMLGTLLTVFLSAAEFEEEDSDELIEDWEDKRFITVGICAMSKKVKAKPMEEILNRIETFQFIKISIFPEATILTKPVEEWPFCNVVQVHEILKDAGIPQPRYGFIQRPLTELNASEQDDQIEINGEVFHKPFVEKPVSAENHEVYIYFPSSAGGGSQRLFRKIGSRSSVYTVENTIRTDGSYVYEEFMPTDGTDVKVYTVGPEYAHAEARKSPALDGKVERDEFGKEVRYPVILRADEKLIAMKICLAFNQTVCGFDLLRANGKSYVCDVNGFSFVKNAVKYYDDCASILGHMIMREFAPTLSIPYALAFQPEDAPFVPTVSGTRMELRCVIAVIRHGDRTPKQKMKMAVLHPLFFQLFEKYDGHKSGQLKLKRPGQLQEVLDIARTLLKELDEKNIERFPNSSETKPKLLQLKMVLEMYGRFSGINRKIQFKYQSNTTGISSKKSSSEDELHDLPPQPSLLLIVKWGGQLTAAGKNQAEKLGEAFRKMYPGGQGVIGDRPDVGLLRLHSTFRHDLKIYASDEGRVQMTAAAFTKGLLALDGELPPILVQMVKSANTNGLLDNDADSTKEQIRVKETLHELLSKDQDFTEEDYEKIAPSRSPSLVTSMNFIKNPVKTCRKVYEYIHEMTILIRSKLLSGSSDLLYHSETWQLMLRRWCKLEKDFYNSHKDRFNINKIPDIYDCIKYDLLHNINVLQFVHAEDLYVYVKALADIVVPQEYGITIEEKLNIARGIVTPLLRKIRTDLQRNLTGFWEEEEHIFKLDGSNSKGIQTPGRHVRTRLYFTSESHVHSLLTMIRYGGLIDACSDEQWKHSMNYLDTVSELNYLTQIVMMLYEDPNEENTSERRFHVELHFSPGAYVCFNSPVDADMPYSNVSGCYDTVVPRGTVLPKSTRQAAHSPPRSQDTNTSVEQSQQSTINASTPCDISRSISPSSVLKTSLSPTKISPQMIKERSLSSKNLYRSHTVTTNMLTGKLKSKTNPVHIDKSLSSTKRMSFSLLVSKNIDNMIKPRSLEDNAPDDSNLQQATLPYSHYNTIHGSSPEDRYQHYVPLTSLFSTRVICGAKSTPDLNKLLERKQQAGIVYSDVQYIKPLETLNTNLNYKILDEFIGKITDPSVRPLTQALIKTDNYEYQNNSKRFTVENVERNLIRRDKDGEQSRAQYRFPKLVQFSISTIKESPHEPNE
ncbi:unnamed protein product, partial [Didymodactylos carnosus]